MKAYGKKCEYCGMDYTAFKENGRFCDKSCRVKAKKKRDDAKSSDSRYQTPDH